MLDRASLKFSLNGEPMQVNSPPGQRLSRLLHDDLGLTGTKTGCDAGDCGACTVLLDGEPVCSCMIACGQVADRHVTTIEGLNGKPEFQRLKQAFLNHGAAQCGICTPAMLVAASALLAHNREPDRSAVETALSGVLCRCTGYRKIIAAVMAAGGDQDRPAPPAAGKAVGAGMVRVDGELKVSGKERFGADQIAQDALWLKIVRSPHAAAQFQIGDTEKFIASHDGIKAVFTAADVPGRNCFGVIPQFADQPVLAEEATRFRGEAVAIIAGEKAAIEVLDVSSFPVKWQPLEAVRDARAALMPDAQAVHENRPGNIMVRGFVERGDVRTGLKEAVHRASISISTPFVEHAYIEPEAGHAVRKGGRLEMFVSTQTPYMDRDEVASIMGIDPENVRISPTACGGGFGSKLDVSVQPLLAIAAWNLDRPVALVYSRPESMMSTTKRHPARMHVTAGCDAKGRITGFDFDGVFDTGAYASWGPTVANRVPVHASGPYHIEHYRARARGVHSNNPPSGAFRGFGVPQAALAQEAVFDELAIRAGIDRLQFRLNNALKNGMATVTGQVFDSGVGITACLEALKPHWQQALDSAEQFNRTADAGFRKGVGIGSCWYGCGNTALPNPSTIKIGMTASGKIVLHQGAVDIGQGANTVIAQIVADTLGIKISKLELAGPDTDITPDAGKTSASRQTYVSGLAARNAASGLRRQICRFAGIADEAAIRLDGSAVLVEQDGRVSRLDLSGLEPDASGYVLVSQATYDPPSKPLDDKGQGDPYPVFGYGAQMMELTVDTRLGTIRLDQLTAAHDVGRAINPLLVEGQIEGGSAQGIGMALMEDYIPGRTENLHDYLIPTIGDVPRVHNIIIEEADPTGPFGAKGLGEHVLIPTAPAILSAIRHATNALITALPATPHRVRAAIRQVEGRS